jgi:hypothetical protein
VLLHGDRNVFREIADLKLRAIGGDRDDKFFLVFGVESPIDKIDVCSPV